MISPFITSLIFTVSATCIAGDCDWRTLLECFFHLPGLQLIKHAKFLKKLNNAMAEMSATEDFAKSMIKWIDTCQELDAKKQWSWEMIQTCMKNDDLSEEEIEQLRFLFEKMEERLTNFVASRHLKKLVINEKKKKENELGNIEASIQEFKMMEAFLESFPQFVLQTCATIHTSFQSILVSSQLKVTLLSSLVSVVSSVTAAFMKMPHISNEQKVPVSQYWKNYLFVGFNMLLMVTPRLVLISIYFACCRYGTSVAFLVVALGAYAIPYWGYAYKEFKQSGKESWKLLVVNFATSLIGPCIVINPRSSLICVSFLISMVGNLVLLSTLQVSALLWPHLFVIPLYDMVPFVKLFMSMVPIIISTSLFSYFQLEEKKQLLALKIGVGSVCCEEKDQLNWALERQYKKVTEHILNTADEVLLSKLEFDLIDAKKLGFVFRDACQKAWLGVVKQLLKHPDSEDFIVSKDDDGKSGLMEACNSGLLEIVEILLEQPNSLDVITQQDNEGKTGLVHACLSDKKDVISRLLSHAGNEEMLSISFQASCTGGWKNIVEFFLALPNYQEILFSKDSRGETGFLKACFSAQRDVVELLLKHPNNEEIIASIDEQGETGYIKACSSGVSEVVVLFLEHPKSQHMMETTNSKGETGLIKASKMGHTTVVDLLLKPLAKDDIYSEFQRLCRRYRNAKLWNDNLTINGSRRTIEFLLTPMKENEARNYQQIIFDNLGDNVSKLNVASTLSEPGDTTVISLLDDIDKPLGEFVKKKTM